MFRATRDASFLEPLERSARYYILKAGPDLVPAWDLQLTDPFAERDSSAAAVTAYGLLQLGAADGPATGMAEIGKRTLDGLLHLLLVSDLTAPNVGAVRPGCY